MLKKYDIKLQSQVENPRFFNVVFKKLSKLLKNQAGQGGQLAYKKAKIIKNPLYLAFIGGRSSLWLHPLKQGVKTMAVKADR